MRSDFPQITKGKGLQIPHSDSRFRIPDSLPSQTLQKHGGQ